MQVLLHVARGPGGRRRLAEIAVLKRTEAGFAVVETAWDAENGPGPGLARLQAMIDARGAS